MNGNFLENLSYKSDEGKKTSKWHCLSKPLTYSLGKNVAVIK